MLLLGIITLVMTIPLASLYLSTILIHGFAFLVFLFGDFIIDSEILGGLFQTILFLQSPLILGGFIEQSFIIINPYYYLF